MEIFPMHRAAREGDLEEVMNLYKQGVIFVDSRDDDNYTPLHWAARRGRYQVAEYLISKNCDLNPRENLGRTPLLLAAYVGCSHHHEVICLLIRNGADVKCGDWENWTLLHRASECNWVQLAQQILETSEIHVNVAMANGKTALHMAAGSKRFDVVGDSGIIRILSEKEGCDLNPQDNDGNTPLHTANTYFHIQNELLAAGASLNVRNNNNKTVFGVYMGNWTVSADEIKLFAEHGAFLEDSDYDIISRRDYLKTGVLKDEHLCTQLIVNKFNYHSLPAVYANPDFARNLPNLKKLQISGKQDVAHEIANFVKADMQKNTYCNVMEARPLVLTLMCVRSLLHS